MIPGLTKTARGEYKFSDQSQASAYLSSLYEAGYEAIAGVDEAGRGPMAGPVVSACVLLPRSHTIKGINDSKKITSAKKRLDLAMQIKEQGLYGVGVCENDEIDAIGIYPATLKAARTAALACYNQNPIDYLLCDGGLILSSTPFPTVSVIKGDGWYECIGAASIIAKVYRDTQMAIYHEVWPEYDFTHNQGYGTKKHLKAIDEYGITTIHRRSFGVCKIAKERR